MVKSEVRMPAGSRHQYTEDFKRETVRLVRESAYPVAQVARDLGILEHVWSRWSTQQRPAEAQGPTPAAQRAEARRTHTHGAAVGTGESETGLFATCRGVFREYRCLYPIRLMCRTLAVRCTTVSGFRKLE
jgi:transposase-like protein